MSDPEMTSAERRGAPTYGGGAAGNFRATPPPSKGRVGGLSQMLRSMSAELAAETPSLDHSVGLTDSGGSPEMKPAPAAYLGLLARKRLLETAEQGPATRRFGEGDDPATWTGPGQRSDDFRRLACRTDPDGRYLTPMRCALERIPDPGRRSFLRALLTNVYFPSDIAQIFGIPAWAADDVAYRSLELLRRRYAERPPAPTRTSEQQQTAEAA